MSKKNETYSFKMKLPVVTRSLTCFDSDELNTLTDFITNTGDVQKRKTNVKAIMSDWYLHDEHPLAQRLCDEAISVVKSIHPYSFNPPEFHTRKCWGAVYGKGDYTKEHNHIPNIYSWCFYLRMPEGSAPLVFPEADLVIEPKECDLIVFSGLARHSVPPCEVDNRIVIAGNIGVK
jgi:hypothetical protein